jgi:hypothetical protein
MSTFAELLHTIPEPDIPEVPIAEPDVETGIAPESAAWDPEQFAAEQIGQLVRQVFLPGWPRPARQVVLSPVDQETDISEVCLRVGESLASQVAGSVCVVEANLPVAKAGVEAPLTSAAFGGVAGLREASRRLSRKLWLVTQDVLMGENQEGFSAAWLRGRLAELRLEFDYTVLQGPAAAMYSQAALLGHLCDGLILVLQANTTRRVAARRVQETLRAAHTRLLGTVLLERTFPIPHSIYRKL